ncbi:hypothetical protein [Sphingomonas sp. UYP23]
MPTPYQRQPFRIGGRYWRAVAAANGGGDGVDHATLQIPRVIGAASGTLQPPMPGFAWLLATPTSLSRTYTVAQSKQEPTKDERNEQKPAVDICAATALAFSFDRTGGRAAVNGAGPCDFG